MSAEAIGAAKTALGSFVARASRERLEREDPETVRILQALGY